jgi:NADH-quinone oxidoreductase subunit A
MFLFYNEYQFIFLYFNICLFFVIFLLIALYVCAVYAPDNNKGVPYECGFLCFSDSRGIFNLKFNILALLFLIFYLEIILLLP